MLNLRKMEIPFSNFQPNTIISSSQANDNFYEIQYKFNLLIDSGILELENGFDDIKKQVNTNTADILKLRSDVNEFTQLVNTKLDQLTIATNDLREQMTGLQADYGAFKTSVNAKLSTLETQMQQVMLSKADNLSYDGSNLLLMSGAVELDRIDLATMINVPSSNPPFKVFNVVADDWLWNAGEDLFTLSLKHDFKTTELLVSEKINGYTNFVSYRATDPNTIMLHNDTKETMRITICVIDNHWETPEGTGTSIDDVVIVKDKTWSSFKINEEVDKLIEMITNLPSGGSKIDDTTIVNNKVWSSSKTNSEINTKVNVVDAKTVTNKNNITSLDTKVTALESQVGKARTDLINETNRNINI